jgi:predicted PurR-regulated permease PerM
MADGSKNVTIQISTGAIMKVILFTLLIAFLFYLRDLILILLTAIVIASAIEPATKWFKKYKIPRVPAVVIIYAVIVAAVFGIFYLFIPAILNDASGFFAQLPQYISSINLSNPLTSGGAISADKVAESVSTVRGFSLESIISDLQASFSNASEGFFRVLSSVFGGIFSLILIVVFSFYLAVQETGIDDFLRIITPAKHQKYIIGLWKRSQNKIGLWMQGQLVLALVIGVLTYLGLTIFGVPYALLLAILAAMFELIPIFGPILAAIPAVIIAFASGGASLGAFVIGLYVIIQQFENHLIYPLVVKKVVGVPPLLVILALIIGAKLAGFLGIILSVPVAAAVQELVADIQKGKEKKLAKGKKAG